MPQAETIADGLLAQHKLLVAVIHTDWATRLDHKVAAVIIERYMRKQGNSRTSLRYLEKATGALRPNVITSTRRLLDHGVFHVVREGMGTRPTEYGLNFQFSASGIADDTASEDSSSGIAHDTAGGIAHDTARAASGIAHDTKNLLTSPADKPADSKVGNECTPAPLADGLAATAGARDPESAFGRFWQIYPRKYQKPKARAAWAKLAPSPELAERIILESGRWAEHYCEHPVDKKWIPAPANWLAGERYDEDLPEVYVDAKEAAIAKKRDKAKNRAEPKTEKTDPEADNDDEPVEWIGEVSAFMTPGRYEFKIAGVRLITEPGKYHDNQSVELMLDSIQSPGFWMPRGVPHRLHVQHDDETLQARDVARLERLGVGEDIDDLIGRTFFATVTRAGYVEYERAAA